jgi:hypothetical protein
LTATRASRPQVYGHLAPGYLKKEIDRLRFEPAPADQGATVIPISAAAVP